MTIYLAAIELLESLACKSCGACYNQAAECSVTAAKLPLNNLAQLVQLLEMLSW